MRAANPPKSASARTGRKARVADGVVGDQLHPGAADRLVVLLRGARVPGGAPDAVADQADRGGHPVPADRQPGELDVLPVTEPAAGPGQHFSHQRVEASGVVVGHAETSVSASRASRKPASAVAGRVGQRPGLQRGDGLADRSGGGLAGRGELDEHDPAVARTAPAADVAAPLQPVEDAGQRGRPDAHRGAELGHRPAAPVSEVGQCVDLRRGQVQVHQLSRQDLQRGVRGPLQGQQGRPGRSCGFVLHDFVLYDIGSSWDECPGASAGRPLPRPRYPARATRPRFPAPTAAAPRPAPPAPAAPPRSPSAARRPAAPGTGIPPPPAGPSPAGRSAARNPST